MIPSRFCSLSELLPPIQLGERRKSGHTSWIPVMDTKGVAGTCVKITDAEVNVRLLLLVD